MGKVVSSQVTFASGPFCMGNSLQPADKNGCTGENVESKGQMTAFFGTHLISTGSQLGPDPQSELILDLLARDASLDWNFKVLPLSSAPGGDCGNLSEK